MEGIIVIVIAPKKTPEESLLEALEVNNGNWTYVGMNEDGEKCEDGDYNNLSFMLINQCQPNAIAEKLGQIAALNKKVIVYTHQSRYDNCEPFPCGNIKAIFNAKIIKCDPFSHSDNGDQPIEKFMSEVNLAWEERKNILQQIICDCIKKKTTSDAHSLRSQILTPFVALHLALQDAEENKDFDLKNECDEACKKRAENDKDEKVKEFLEKNGLDGKYNDLKSKIDSLCEAIADNKTDELAAFKDLYEGPESKNGLIGEFAKLLEDAVETAEK